MKILITGSRGQLGVEFARAFRTHAAIQGYDLSDLDICNAHSVSIAFESFRPDFVINTAAYTAVDNAEQQPAIARAVNAEGPRILAEAAQRVGAGLVHFSTDYVFSGTKQTPYFESDPTDPQSIYGESKADGEQAVLHSGAPHLVLRTSWIYGTHGKNFLLTILRLACEREELSVVDDQIGAPTWSRSLAQATRDILLKVRTPQTLHTVGGLYHLTSAGQTSWCGFARAILEQARTLQTPPAWMQAITAGRPFKVQEVRAIPTSEYPLPAKRPAWSVLSNEKITRSLGVAIPDWYEQLMTVMRSSE